MHKLWRRLGSPTDGAINSARLKAKLDYKNALKEASNNSSKSCSTSLSISFLNHDSTSFWKIWNDKFNNKNAYIGPVSGFSHPSDIASAFRDHYCTTFVNSYDDLSAVNEYSEILNKLNENDDIPSVDIDIIERCIAKLKHNKAAGHDNITAEHISYSHPAIVLHIKWLFTMMLKYSYVPDDFGIGIIVPVIKDHHGDPTSVDNYRPITLSPVISKIFENLLIEHYANYLCTDDLQFGFKKRLSCSHAIYLLKQTIEYLTLTIAMCIWPHWTFLKRLTD